MLTAPGTVASSRRDRIVSYSVRLATYLGVTVPALRGNLNERELPRRKLAWLLGLVAVYTVIGGLGGVLVPHLHFTAPLAALVPQRLEANNLVLQAQLHPSMAQIQGIRARPGPSRRPLRLYQRMG